MPYKSKDHNCGNHCTKCNNKKNEPWFTNWEHKFTNLRRLWSYHSKKYMRPTTFCSNWEHQRFENTKCNCSTSNELYADDDYYNELESTQSVPNTKSISSSSFNNTSPIACYYTISNKSLYNIRKEYADNYTQVDFGPPTVSKKIQTSFSVNRSSFSSPETYYYESERSAEYASTPKFSRSTSSITPPIDNISRESENKELLRCPQCRCLFENIDGNAVVYDNPEANESYESFVSNMAVPIPKSRKSSVNYQSTNSLPESHYFDTTVQKSVTLPRNTIQNSNDVTPTSSATSNENEAIDDQQRLGDEERVYNESKQTNNRRSVQIRAPNEIDQCNNKIRYSTQRKCRAPDDQERRSINRRREKAHSKVLNETRNLCKSCDNKQYVSKSKHCPYQKEKGSITPKPCIRNNTETQLNQTNTKRQSVIRFSTTVENQEPSNASEQSNDNIAYSEKRYSQIDEAVSCTSVNCSEESCDVLSNREDTPTDSTRSSMQEICSEPNLMPEEPEYCRQQCFCKPNLNETDDMHGRQQCFCKPNLNETDDMLEEPEHGRQQCFCKSNSSHESFTQNYYQQWGGDVDHQNRRNTQNYHNTPVRYSESRTLEKHKSENRLLKMINKTLKHCNLELCSCKHDQNCCYNPDCPSVRNPSVQSSCARFENRTSPCNTPPCRPSPPCTPPPPLCSRPSPTCIPPPPPCSRPLPRSSPCKPSPPPRPSPPCKPPPPPCSRPSPPCKPRPPPCSRPSPPCKPPPPPCSRPSPPCIPSPPPCRPSPPCTPPSPPCTPPPPPSKEPMEIPKPRTPRKKKQVPQPTDDKCPYKPKFKKQYQERCPSEQKRQKSAQVQKSCHEKCLYEQKVLKPIQEKGSSVEQKPIQVIHPSFEQKPKQIKHTSFEQKPVESAAEQSIERQNKRTHCSEKSCEQNPVEPAQERHSRHRVKCSNRRNHCSAKSYEEKPVEPAQEQNSRHGVKRPNQRNHCSAKSCEQKLAEPAQEQSSRHRIEHHGNAKSCGNPSEYCEKSSTNSETIVKNTLYCKSNPSKSSLKSECCIQEDCPRHKVKKCNPVRIADCVSSPPQPSIKSLYSASNVRKPSLPEYNIKTDCKPDRCSRCDRRDEQSPCTCCEYCLCKNFDKNSKLKNKGVKSPCIDNKTGKPNPCAKCCIDGRSVCDCCDYCICKSFPKVEKKSKLANTLYTSPCIDEKGTSKSNIKKVNIYCNTCTKYLQKKQKLISKTFETIKKTSTCNFANCECTIDRKPSLKVIIDKINSCATLDTMRSLDSTNCLRRSSAKSVLPSKSFTKEKQKHKAKQKKTRTRKKLEPIIKIVRPVIAREKNKKQETKEKSISQQSSGLYGNNIEKQYLKKAIETVPSNMYPDVPHIQFIVKGPGPQIKLLKIKNLYKTSGLCTIPIIRKQ